MFEWLAGRVEPVAVRPRRAVCRGPEGHVRAPGARPHRRAAGGEEHARCRAGPHGAGGRADPGGRPRRAENDGLVAARARPALPGAVGQLVRNGRALEKLPAVAAAFAGGAVTADAVSVIAAVAKPENLTLAEAQDVDLGGGGCDADRSRDDPAACGA